jgi:serine/threonine protein kinase
MLASASSALDHESTDRPTLAPGTIFGGYRIDQRIGRGGIAEVFAAKELYAGREVALKTLRPEYCALPEFVERMKREAILTTQLRHRNIVMCFGAGVVGRRPWLALERLGGLTLRQKLQQSGPLWPHEVLSLVRQAAMGLHAAHRRGIVHRDIKPENLFIERQRLILLDFGFAKAESHGSVTDPFATPGTIAYMAPEQILRKPADPRTDLYALGICAYEALAGQHPFTNAPDVWPTDDVMAQFHLEDPPYPLTELIGGFPPAIWNIIEKCLSKDPTKRYPDAQRMAAALLDQERKLTRDPSHERFNRVGNRDVATEGRDKNTSDTSPIPKTRAARHTSLFHPTAESLSVFEGWLGKPGEGVVAHVGADGTAAWASVSDWSIYAGGTQTPTDRDWNAYLEWLAPRCPSGEIVRSLVLDPGSGPSPSQRSRLTTVTSRCAVRAAVLAPSAVIRGIVTALNWFKSDSYRAFSPSELREAIVYLGATGDVAAELEHAAHQLLERISPLASTEPKSGTALPEIVACDRDHCIGTWRNFLLVLWRGQTRVVSVEATRPVLEQLARRSPNSVGMISIVEDHAPAPSAEARAAIARLFASVAKDVVASAVAVEGTGFRAAFVRGVVTSLTMLARQPFPHKVFPGLQEAAAWLTPQGPFVAPHTATANQLVDAVTRWRAEYGARIGAGGIGSAA